MSRDFDGRFPRCHIGPNDRITIDGVAFTLADQTGEAFILAPAEGGGLPQTFPFGHLNRLNAAGKVRHEPEHLVPAHRRRAASAARARPRSPCSARSRRRVSISATPSSRRSTLSTRKAGSAEARSPSPT